MELVNVKSLIDNSGGGDGGTDENVTRLFNQIRLRNNGESQRMQGLKDGESDDGNDENDHEYAEAEVIIDDNGDFQELMGESGEDDDDDQTINNETENSVNLTDNSMAHLLGHTSSVFSITLHPIFNHVIVTGGADDTACVYNLHDIMNKNETQTEIDSVNFIEPVSKLTSHTDSIINLAFTQPDGQYLLTAGMDGMVKVWYTNPTSFDDWQMVHEIHEVEEVTWLSVRPYPQNNDTHLALHSNVFAFGGTDGSVWIYEINCETFPPTCTLVHSLFTLAQSTSASACTAGMWTHNGEFLLTCSQGSLCSLFAPFTRSPHHMSSVKDETEIINPSPTLFTLGPHDTRFNVEGGLFSIAISQNNTLAALGGSNGMIRILRLPNVNIANDTCISRSRSGPIVDKSASFDRLIACINLQKDSIESVAFSEDNSSRFLASGSVDGSIAVFETLNSAFKPFRFTPDAHMSFAVVKLKFLPPSLHNINATDASTSTTIHSVNASWLLASCGSDAVLRIWDLRLTPDQPQTSTLLRTPSTVCVRQFSGHQLPSLTKIPRQSVPSLDGTETIMDEDDNDEEQSCGILDFAIIKATQSSAMFVTAGDDSMSLVFQA